MCKINNAQSEQCKVVNPQQSLESTQNANTNDADKQVEGVSTLDTANLAVEKSSANDVTTEDVVVSEIEGKSNNIPGVDEVTDNSQLEQQKVVEVLDTSTALEEGNVEEILPNSYFHQKQEEKNDYESFLVEKDDIIADKGDEEDKETSTDFICEEFYNSLPSELQAFLNLYKGREKDIVLLSVLGVFSSLLPNVSGFYRGEVHYPNLFIQIIAPPASGKGKMKVGISVFDRILRKLSEEKKDFRIPGNSSSVRVIEKLNKMKGFGNLMFETEADSISGIQKNEWGNFSDILRKAAQHEEISISRKGNNVDIKCNSPRLSLLVSGTPDQLAPLIKSVDNGLYSRFVYYAFRDVISWGFYKEQPQQLEVVGILEEFLEQKILKVQESKTTFRFSETQQQDFDLFFSDLAESILYVNPKLFSSIERLGYITFRIMMMLTILGNDDLQEDEVISDNVFVSTLQLVPTLLEHIIKTSTIYGNKVVVTDRLTKFLEKLPCEFTSAELKMSQTLGSASTIDKNVKLLVELHKLDKIKHGHYKKI